MIGMRGGLSVTLSAVICATALSDSAGPARMVAADRLVADRAASADAALERLERALAPALEAARRGAARTVTGDESPSEPFATAAEAVEAARDGAATAAEAIGRLDAARRVRQPGAAPIGAPVAPDGLPSLAAQLRATGVAADAFAVLRADADRVTEELERALSALADGDLDAAEGAAREARRAHDAVASWESPPASLPVWLDTTGAMIGAMERIVTATRAGDAAAARGAAEAFTALGEDAATADRALRIAVSEGGSALTGTALGRLAGHADAVASARAAVADILADRRR